jgi:DNA replication protein DnaC
METELIATLKSLRLSNLLGHWDEYMALAQKRNASLVQILRRILEDEAKAKQGNVRTQRLRRARIPEPWVLETYPFEKQPKLNKKKILSIYDAFDYVEKHRNIVWMGPTGCGKTGLATSFLIHAIHRGHTGRFVSFPNLVGELYASVADHSEEKVLRRYSSYDCLLIDEVGYVEVEPTHVGLFFTLMQRRHKKRSTLVTSNLGFSEWRSFLKNGHLTVALIDRLTEESHVINMKGCMSLRSGPEEIS